MTTLGQAVAYFLLDLRSHESVRVAHRILRSQAPWGEVVRPVLPSGDLNTMPLPSSPAERDRTCRYQATSHMTMMGLVYGGRLDPTELEGLVGVRFHLIDGEVWMYHTQYAVTLVGRRPWMSIHAILDDDGRQELMPCEPSDYPVSQDLPDGEYMVYEPGRAVRLCEAWERA